MSRRNWRAIGAKIAMKKIIKSNTCSSLNAINAQMRKTPNTNTNKVYKIFKI